MRDAAPGTPECSWRGAAVVWLQEVLGVFSNEPVKGAPQLGMGFPQVSVCPCLSHLSVEAFLTLLITKNARKEAKAQSQSAPEHAGAGQRGCAPRNCEGEGAQLHTGPHHAISTAEHIFLYTGNEFARREIFGLFYLFKFFFLVQ